MSTLDGDPFDLNQEPFKYLNPVSDEIHYLFPSINILISDIKKMMGKKVENISNFRFINENFNELGESWNDFSAIPNFRIVKVLNSKIEEANKLTE